MYCEQVIHTPERWNNIYSTVKKRQNTKCCALHRHCWSTACHFHYQHIQCSFSGANVLRGQVELCLNPLIIIIAVIVPSYEMSLSNPKSIHKWAGRGGKWSGRAEISFIDVLVLCCSFCAYFGRWQGANYGNTHTHKLTRMTVTELNILSELVGVCCIRLRDRMRECVPGGWPQRTWLITHIDRPTSSRHTRPMCATFSRPLVTIHLVFTINFVSVVQTSCFAL